MSNIFLGAFYNSLIQSLSISIPNLTDQQLYYHLPQIGLLNHIDARVAMSSLSKF